MTQHRHFYENAQRLASILGDWVPPCDDHLLRQADRLVRREIFRGEDGRSWVPGDLAQLDWTGQSAGSGLGHRMLMMFGLLTPLAAAFRHTGDARYAWSARQYLEAFLQAYPVTESWLPPTHDGPTSYPGRIGVSRHGGWMGMLPAFAGSAAFDDDFVARIIDAVRHVLSYQMAHVYPGRNIRILHGDLLLLNGLRLDFLPESAAWRAMGVRVLNDAVNRQLLHDGADMEGSPEYHCDVLYVLVPVWKLARAFPELGLRIPSGKLAAMFDYALAASRPDGGLTSLNDSSYFPARGNFGDHAARARREFLQDARLPDVMPPLCRHYADVGQVFLRDDWGPGATYLTFDATTRQGWHWHPGRNAIQLFANQRALLVDPGYPTHSPEWPTYGHRTPHHNTLNLDGLDQSHAPARARFRQAPGYDLVEGLYSGGYWPTGDNTHGRGIFGEHHRTLLWMRDRCIIVLDHLATMPEPGDEFTIESVWQFGDGAVEPRDAGRAAVTCHPDSNLLMLFPLMPAGMQTTIHAGDRDPMRGWVPDYSRNGYLPAPMVRLHVSAREPWKTDLATVLIPFRGAEAPRIRAAASPPGIEFMSRDAGRLDLEWPDGSRDRIIWMPRLEEAIDCQHGVDTDASLVHLHFDATGHFARGLAVDANFLRCAEADTGDLLAAVQRI